MGDIETTKKRQNRFMDIIKNVATAGGVVGIGGGFGPIVLWGGGLAVATAITAISIRINKAKNQLQNPGKEHQAENLHSVDLRKKLKNNCCVAMIRGIEDKCINGFRLALHNPSRSLHHHALSLSKVEIEGQEVSTQYLISDEKIVLQVEWKHETASCSKEEIVIFDNLQTRKVKSVEDHPQLLKLEQSALEMLSVNPDDFAGKDPLGTFIQTIKDNRKALEHIVNAKQALDEGEEEHEDGDGKREVQRSEPIQESPMEEKETGKDVNDKVVNEEGSVLIPGKMGTAKAGILHKTINTMRMHIWVFLVVVVMLILLASPKLLAY